MTVTEATRNEWKRGLYMLLFVIAYQLAEILVAAVVVVQFVARLASGRSVERLQGFGRSLSRYVFDVLRFLTYNSETMPFPFAEWPDPDDHRSGE